MLKALTVVLVFCVVMIDFCPNSWGQIFSEVDSMQVISVIGQPGDTLSIPIDLLNTFAVGGFQVRLTFDSLSFIPVSISLAPRAQVLDLFGGDLDPGVVSFFAASQHPMDYYLDAGRGDVVYLGLAVRNWVSPGSYLIRFENVDSVSHQNALSNIRGDSLVIPVLIPHQVHVLPLSAWDNNSLPQAFELQQNYPNPFNGATRIVFALDSPGPVDLSVFDLLGRRVATLYSGFADKGETSVAWNGRNGYGDDVNSGPYFYRLETNGGMVVTRKMTLLK